MNPIRTKSLTRQQIGDFITSPRGVRAFEDVQGDIASQYDALTGASFLTLSSEPTLGSERTLDLAVGELTGVDGGANSAYSLGLANTAVVAGGYGSASKTVAVTVDAKGRVTALTEYALTTSNVSEGTNLYYTDARARAALSASGGVTYNSATGAITATAAGTYGAPSGTLSRASMASYTAGTTLTFSTTYVQAELTALATRLATVETALQTASRTLAALLTDMKANGNLT